MEKKFKGNKAHIEFAKMCAALSNPTRIAIISRIAESSSCVKGDFLEMEEITKFTSGQNIKQLSKIGLVNGSFKRKTINYCLNYEQLANWKAIVDNLYELWIQNREKVNPNNAPCQDKHPATTIKSSFSDN